MYANGNGPLWIMGHVVDGGGGDDDDDDYDYTMMTRLHDGWARGRGCGRGGRERDRASEKTRIER